MPRILIVDDAAFMRMSIKRMIEKDNYEIVAEACDGVQAVAMYKQFKPDVTTMDITMPNMTGIEALKEIKKIDSEAKIIMISAMGQEALIRESVMSGASSFLVKPFQKEKLLEVLNSVCS